MTLEPLTRDDADQIRIWRNDPRVLPSLRTTKMLTHDEQQEWYTREIANRESHTRYWALRRDISLDATEEVANYTFSRACHTPYRPLLGYGGIEHISWEARNGEISLLIDPDKWGKGLGSEAVGLFLDQAFSHLNLTTVYGECYYCAAVGFWEKMVAKNEGTHDGDLRCRKYYKGKQYSSYYFTFYGHDWKCNVYNSGKAPE